MRSVDVRRIKLPPDWRAKADKAQAEIDGKVCEPSAGYAVWSQLKLHLKDLSDGKCWYCESRESRSDNAVDHFRPKSLYPWFACDYENFRYACTFCNSIRRNPDTGESSGKGNHFPLLKGKRAQSARERNAEEYVLLDPCKSTDVVMLDFRDDGRSYPRFPRNEVKKHRALESIRYYHLDHPELVETRRQLALDIHDWIESIDEIYSDSSYDSPANKKAIETLHSNLVRAMDRKSPFSTFAKKMVKGYENREWVAALLECA